MAPDQLPLPQLLDISQLNGSPRPNPVPGFATNYPSWATDVVSGRTFDGTPDHPFEWVSVLNQEVEQDDEVGLAGTALRPDMSSSDLPFTHPFGPDFEFTIVPDPPYDSLLAEANKVRDGAYRASWRAAENSGIHVPTGVLGVEIDAALVPNEYQVAHGDRVAVYGRWIVDAGHPEFHTEIHPPLLMARARSVDNHGNLAPRNASATTLFQLWSRPYQAGQLFSNDGDTGLALREYAGRIASAAGDIQAFPPIFPQPFQGIHIVAFTVRPPVLMPAPPKPGPLGPPIAQVPSVQLQCSYHFTVNGPYGVEVIPSPADPSSILVIIALNSISYPALPEPAHEFDRYSIEKLLSQVPGGADLGWLESEFLKIKKYLYVRRYAAPRMSQTQDLINVVPFSPLNSLPRSATATDSSQPFPIYGWLKLQWVNAGPLVATARATVSGGEPAYGN